jgi:beclin 1
VFEISSAGEFGTISGFRLGKHTTIDIKWEECNAALGQVAYLLCVLAHRFQYKLDKHYLYLRGSFSTIAYRANAKDEFPLFMGQGDSNFNSALEMLLDTIKRFLAELQRTRPELEKVLRIKASDITNDHIKSSTVKFSKDNEEEWS